MVRHFYGKLKIWEMVIHQPTVTDDAVYVTGRKDSSDVLTALTLDGKLNGKQSMVKHG